MRGRKTKDKRITFLIIGTVILALFITSFSIGEKYYRKDIVVSASNTPNAVQINNVQPIKVDKVNTGPDKLKQPVVVNANDKNETKIPPVEKVDKQIPAPGGTKEAFLTFDDGPTPGITSEVLDILKKYDVKATFFVIGKMASASPEFIRREKAEGHAIGNHTFSHDYKIIYTEPKNFIEDLGKAESVIKGILPDYNGKLIRFPGGSFGKVREPYRQAVTAAGYHYVDWNALNGDAEQAGIIPADKLVERLKQTAGNQNHLVVLMHDAPTKQTTVQALPQIIEYLKANGYTFKTLE